MLTEYDEQGNYKFPEGFDPETNEWREGFDTQREEWEQQYAAAQARWEAHKKQVAASQAAQADESFGAPAGGSAAGSGAATYSSETAGAGTLADDASLAALREKLSSNN
jgi:small subunit ribosomal protein S1